MKVEIQTYRAAVGEITHVSLTNESDASVTLSNLGASIVAIRVPDRNGTLADVVIGADCSGRFANYIWKVEHIGSDEVVFAYHSVDLGVSVTYRWTEDNVLEIYLSATTDRSAVVNLTNHVYFNLEGKNAESVLDEYLWVNASRYLPTKDNHNISSVVGTVPAFTTAKRIGQGITLCSDNCWVINDWEEGVMNEAAVLASHRSGRQLSVFTTLPLVQVRMRVKDCAISQDYDGVAIECHGMPDVRLKPGDEYKQLIFLNFSTF